MSKEKVGTLFVELGLDLSPFKRTLKNLLTAIEASEKGIDVSPDFIGKNPPTFGVAIGGKLFSSSDLDAIRGAIRSGEIIV